MFQPALGLHGGHAAGTGSRDRLPEDGILDVAARKDTGYIRARRTRLGLDISQVVEIDLATNEAELKRLDAVVKQVEELEKAAAAVRARLNVIEDLLLGRAFYPVFMSEFARSVPAGVRVNSMTTAATTPGTVKLMIGAIANSNEDIAAWVKTLEKNAKFGMIELGAVTASGTSFTFAITATYTSK